MTLKGEKTPDEWANDQIDLADEVVKCVRRIWNIPIGPELREAIIAYEKGKEW